MRLSIRINLNSAHACWHQSSRLQKIFWRATLLLFSSALQLFSYARSLVEVSLHSITICSLIVAHIKAIRKPQEKSCTVQTFHTGMSAKVLRILCEDQICCQNWQAVEFDNHDRILQFPRNAKCLRSYVMNCKADAENSRILSKIKYIAARMSMDRIFKFKSKFIGSWLPNMLWHG